jgi:hypothetical protein
MYDEKHGLPDPSKGKVQLREASSTPSRTALRGMDYAQGQAHLAPVQRSEGEEEAAPEGNKEIILRLVGAFVDSKFKGDPQLAFNAYANEGVVDQAGVTRLLIDAGVKKEFKWTFGLVPGKVMAHFDKDGSGKISQNEFDAGMKAQ